MQPRGAGGDHDALPPALRRDRGPWLEPAGQDGALPRGSTPAPAGVRGALAADVAALRARAGASAACTAIDGGPAVASACVAPSPARRSTRRCPRAGGCEMDRLRSQAGGGGEHTGDVSERSAGRARPRDSGGAGGRRARGAARRRAAGRELAARCRRAARRRTPRARCRPRRAAPSWSALLDGEPVGSAGMPPPRRHDRRLKRMATLPAARQARRRARGVSLEERARALGYRRLVLDGQPPARGGRPVCSGELERAALGDYFADESSWARPRPGMSSSSRRLPPERRRRPARRSLGAGAWALEGWYWRAAESASGRVVAVMSDDAARAARGSATSS